MIIEIKGAGYVNKGAELMLKSVLYKEGVFDKNVKFIVNMFSGSFRNRNLSGVGHLAWLHTWNYVIVAHFIEKFFSIIPKKIRRYFNIYIPEEIDYIFDISGFIYSDQFNSKASIRVASYYEKRVLDGAKIILMPQAVGPFENPKIKYAVLKIFQLSNLIFIRDKISFDYFLKLDKNIKRAYLCPDFTFFIKEDDSKLNRKLVGKVCIIPNEKIFSSKKIIFENYINTLNQVISFCKNKNVEVFFLIHEAKKDLSLLKKVSSNLEHNIEYIIEQNPLKLKSIIKNSKFVVSSRYHGLISSLYQGVPIIATGWSHKYHQLLCEYDIESHMIEYANEHNMKKLLDNMFNDKYVEKIKLKIDMENNRRKKRLDWMWGKIRSTLVPNIY